MMFLYTNKLKNFAANPASSKTNVSSCLGIFIAIAFCLGMTSLQSSVHFGMSVENILNECCQTGDIQGLLWVVQQKKKAGASFSSAQIEKAIEKTVTGGFDSLLLQIKHLYDIDCFDAACKEKWVNLALAAGFPNTVRTLEHHFHASLSPKQQEELHILIDVLNQHPAVSPPAPINAQHDQVHGGKANYQIYEKEYRKSVAFVLHHLGNGNCDFRALIENLGHRRRHMAGRGKLGGLEMYGVPTGEYHTYTFYNPVYASYGKKIREKYAQLPMTVTVDLNGAKISLTEITEQKWVHPNGAHREELLEKIASLCRAVHTTTYPEDCTQQLAYDLGKIIWWFSHAPPFMRGVPTIISMMMDGFWIYHHRTPLVNSPDLNCEALCCDNEEEFASYMFNREDLPL